MTDSADQADDDVTEFGVAECKAALKAGRRPMAPLDNWPNRVFYGDAVDRA